MTDIRDELRRPLAWAVEKILDDTMRAIDSAEERARRETARCLWLAEALGYWFGTLRFFEREDGSNAATWLLERMEKHPVTEFTDHEWGALADGIKSSFDATPVAPFMEPEAS